MPHIHIVGTSHISSESVATIKKAFLDFKPDIIAVELDRNRLEGLLKGQHEQQTKRLPISSIRQIGLTGYLFAIIGKFAQKKLGNIVGTNPGADMKQAALLAKNNQKQLLLLDQDLHLTLKKLSQTMKGREKRRILKDLLFGWMSKKNQGKVHIDLSKVPQEELITQLLEQTKDRYPTLYKVLVHDRNVFMAKRLLLAGMRFPQAKILVVIGAGHKKGLQEELEKAHKEFLAEIKKPKEKAQEEKETNKTHQQKHS